MYGSFREHLESTLKGIRDAGFYKDERIITGPQGARIGVVPDRSVLNLCANNYLGLAGDQRLAAAARDALASWGYGLASVRFICGTQLIHRRLEEKLSAFLDKADTILYSSCFDANAGLFETLLGPEDAIVSDELNHASIIDGVRLCKARRYRYRNNDMDDLRAQLQAARSEGARHVMVTTDGVFSMDGSIAQVDRICDLAEEFEALVHVDDSHATGILGPTGRGSPEFRRCMDRVDILTSTLGKALGGASGGFTSSHREIVALLRQRSRPYLFSNTVAPAIVAGAIAALDLLASEGEALRNRLRENAQRFRSSMAAGGFDLLPGEHPIIPVMIYNAADAGRLAAALLEKGVYVIAFSYPVVPKGKARIRTQISAGHSGEDLDFAARMFAEARDSAGAPAGGR